MTLLNLPKKYIVANAVLFSMTAAVVCYVLYKQEENRANLRGTSFAHYLLNSGIEKHRFVLRNEDSWVPNDEFYDPFPEVTGYRQLPLEVLQAAQRYQKTCSARDLESADKVARFHAMSPSKLIEWNHALCTKDFEKFRLWVERPPFLHPSGVSYAKLFDERTAGVGANEKYYHVRERANLSDFDRWYLTMTPDKQAMYTEATHSVVTTGEEIAVASDWTGSSREVAIFTLAAVNSHLRDNFSMQVYPRLESERCDHQHYGLCLSKVESSPLQWKTRWTVPVLLGIVTFLFLSLLFLYLDWRRIYRLRNADQALLFQVISHEIRTPLTALKLSTDGLRQQFDSLDPKSQQHFMKLLDGFHDLEVIVTRTLKELKGGNLASRLDLVEITQNVVETRYKDVVKFKTSEDSLPVRMSDFWFEICLTNLIRNSLLHGQAPVTVTVKREGKYACVEVQDSGTASLWRLTSFARPLSRRKSTRGLGIGLTIVARKMREAGGKLVARNSPTRYILQFKAFGGDQ